jgi:hypothetical protein
LPPLLQACWRCSGSAPATSSPNPLALTITLVIGATYVMGGLEMRRFSADTTRLDAALANIPAPLEKLGDWLDTVPPALQNAVRLRVEGQRSGLPGPALTPYLTGLLVMLGMLGTFLGMVVTLNGAVFALQGSTDLEAMRSALSAPIRGLGLAFGTSVAGVACSAMLGFVSALCRRERQQVGQVLDARIATDLHVFSLAHQRQASFKALQTQAQALPEVVGTLQQMMAAMERQNQQLHERMVSHQEGFHRDVKGVYTELAHSVDASLKSSLSESARAASATLQPMVESTLQGIARETAALRDTLADTVTRQLDGIATRFDTTVSRVESTWTASLDRHTQRSDTLSSQLQQSLAAFAESFEQRSAALVATLQADLARRTAAAAPRAAAEVIGQLRQELSAQHGARQCPARRAQPHHGNAGALLDAINHASPNSARHRRAGGLVGRPARTHRQPVRPGGSRPAGTRIDSAARSAAVRVEVASLGEAFGLRRAAVRRLQRQD